MTLIGVGTHESGSSDYSSTPGAFKVTFEHDVKIPRVSALSSALVIYVISISFPSTFVFLGFFCLFIRHSMRAYTRVPLEDRFVSPFRLFFRVIFDLAWRTVVIFTVSTFSLQVTIEIRDRQTDRQKERELSNPLAVLLISTAGEGPLVTRVPWAILQCQLTMTFATHVMGHRPPKELWDLSARKVLTRRHTFALCYPINY